MIYLDSAALIKLVRIEAESAALIGWLAAEPNLRSLDTIHLATAEYLAASGKKVTAVITYDKRLAEAARQGNSFRSV